MCLPTLSLGPEKSRLSVLCFDQQDLVRSLLFTFSSLPLFISSSFFHQLHSFHLRFKSHIHSSTAPFLASHYQLFLAHTITLLQRITTFAMVSQLISVLACAGLVSANPLVSVRTVASLDEAAVAEAQQRDDTATRASSNINIKVCPALRPCVISKLTTHW